MLEELVGGLIFFASIAVIIAIIVLAFKISDYIHDKKDNKMLAKLNKVYPALSASMDECTHLRQAILDVWNNYYADIYGKMKKKRQMLSTATNSEREKLSIEIDEMQKICDEGEHKQQEIDRQETELFEQILNEIDTITDKKMIKFLNRRGWHR